MREWIGHPEITQIRGRVTFVFLATGTLRVDGHSLLLEQESRHIEIPVAASTVLLLEPGTTVTHDAIKLCAQFQTLLVWIGEGGVRLYSAGMPGGSSSKRLLEQARIVDNEKLRVAAARRMYSLMFEDPPPPSFTIEKLRGVEGAKVRAIYAQLAQQNGLS